MFIQGIFETFHLRVFRKDSSMLFVKNFAVSFDQKKSLFFRSEKLQHLINTNIAFERKKERKKERESNFICMLSNAIVIFSKAIYFINPSSK